MKTIKNPRGQGIAYICAILASLGPLSISLYTPSMPVIADHLHTTQHLVGLSLSVYLMAFGFSQLIVGAISDIKGRRPVAILFLLIYLLGSLLCTLTPNLSILMLGRLLQGVGAAGGVVLSRAIVFDLFKGQEAARLINLTSLILIVAPALAPFFGGYLLELTGWRSIFVALIVLAVLSLLVIYRFFAETLDPQAQGANHNVVATYWKILCRRRFFCPILSVGFITASVYTLSTALPFIIIRKYGISPMHYGLLMTSQAGFFGVSTLMTRKLLKHYDGLAIARYGYVIIAAGALVYFAQGRVAAGSPTLLITGLSLLAYGNAMINPGMIARGFRFAQEGRASASALLGMFQMGGGFLGSLIVTSLFQDYLYAVTVIVPLFITLSVILGCLTYHQARQDS